MLVEIEQHVGRQFDADFPTRHLGVEVLQHALDTPCLALDTTCHVLDITCHGDDIEYFCTAERSTGGRLHGRIVGVWILLRRHRADGKCQQQCGDTT